MARLIQPEGTETTVEPRNGSDFDLEELQGFTGGYIEMLGLPDGSLMVINEDGKGQHLGYNRVATALCRTLNVGLAPDDYIVGPALICKGSEVQ